MHLLRLGAKWKEPRLLILSLEIFKMEGYIIASLVRSVTNPRFRFRVIERPAHAID